MKYNKLLLLTLLTSLLFVGCNKKDNQTSSIDDEDSSDTSSTYYGPRDLYVAFFIDYNMASLDFDNPYYSYKTEQGMLLTRPEDPTPEMASDPTYPIFKGWSAHTLIDDDEDLWDFDHDMVGLGERSYLYLYGIWEAEDIGDDTEATNYAMYRTSGGQWNKKEMSINPNNTSEYMITDLQLEADTEIVFHIDDGWEGSWYHYSDLKPESVGTYVESPSYQHEDGETYSDGNIIVKQAGKYAIYLDTTAIKDTNKAIYMARDTSEDPVTEKIFYLSPGVWDVDGAWFAIYAFGNGNEWYTMNKVGTYYQASINITKYNSLIFVRMNPAKTIADGWDGKWNQSSDLKVSDGNLYTITGWDSGSWSTI